DGFRDANLCAIFWVPEANARTFFEAAANFIDYRTRLVEVGIDDTSSRSFIPRVVTIHNLPYASLGPIYLDQRAEELASLDAALKEHRATVVGQPIAIQGLGGIGKTRLAVEYAWLHLSDYTHVLFVRADSPDILRTHLANLAHPLLLNLPEDQDADERAKYRAVVDWLATKPGWLLIVDNADDEHAAEAVDKLLPKLDQGSVIITSRYRRWSGEVQRQDLGMLTPAAAKSVLLDETQGFRSETSTDDEDAEQLADRLGYLPLALVQAAAYIRVHGITVDEYLQLWKQESRQVKQWHDDRVMNYPHSVAVTWQISVDLLEGRGKYAALSLLNLMAWLSPEPIPRTLFKSLGTTNPMIVLPNLDEETAESIEWTPPLIEARLNDLADYNLIKLEQDTISVHRVVQEILRTRQEQPRDWLQSTLYLLA
ncbi:MAG: hypothetical protein KDA59_25845, partial [Planctomycetales bacterium]|nr:hypothetical protein [Planctomycetales bacterium]